MKPDTRPYRPIDAPRPVAPSPDPRPTAVLLAAIKASTPMVLAAGLKTDVPAEYR